jgi:protein arginine N-methyltransferase 1
MYNVANYGEMIADRVRMDAYARALRAAVTPKSVVLDLGAGTGIFTLLACRFGARRVYAIEPDDALQVARETVARNGYADRVEFVQAPSAEVTLPESVDVIVSDLRGLLPLFNHHLKSIADARRRFLKPGGWLIPQRDTLWAAAVEAPELYASVVAGCSEDGFDMAAARKIATQILRKAQLEERHVLLEPQPWLILDYAIQEEGEVSAQVTWTAARAGTAHGLALWFETVLAEGIGFSTGPAAPKTIYRQMFYPWAEPVGLAAGDVVAVALRANPVGEDYVWRWDACVRTPAGLCKAEFQQSTFFGAPLTAEGLRKRASTYVPSLDLEGEIERFILVRMDGASSLELIARQASECFPQRFARWEDALLRVSDLSQRYSR